MVTLYKDNPVLAELDIFVTQPDQQWLLIDSLLLYTQNILKQQPGYIASVVHRSFDGFRVINYVQWQSQANYEAYITTREIAPATKITGFFA
ncbi:hypothetical protein FNW02_36925 [Komarekiella sp. 'clone 1']|uniref:ABM domain-containing protein n=1 Tax=Komarekiella delphini-convector SJRDD-AB1 TaxID=2593771 RepID=A0AA41BAE3_9NOST|nr:antibiotic biosynthesis monooxygenase [Komarekiella delphini-convector]MBD6621144.1 hypothetical protein [Komarekiella delphini-convector SJRDD-AB1]